MEYSISFFFFAGEAAKKKKEKRSFMDYNPPNTRERIAARRRQRQGRSDEGGGSQVRPGARRVLLEWLSSGRLLSALIFVVCIIALGYLLTDARFSVQHVNVEGNSALKAEEVANLSNLAGRPIWFANLTEAETQLLENAYIEAAEISVALPDQATIRIVERRPEVRWQAGGMQYLVDASGQVLGVAQEAAADNVLVVVDNSNLKLEPNDQLDPDALRLTQTLAMRLPAELGFAPAQIGWDMGLGVYVRSAAGQTIVFGSSANLDRKLAILDYLLKDQTSFTYLDLRPANPFYQDGQRPTTVVPSIP